MEGHNQHAQAIHRSAHVHPDGYIESAARNTNPTRAYSTEHLIDPADPTSPSPIAHETQDTYTSGENGDTAEEDDIISPAGTAQRARLLDLISRHPVLLEADHLVNRSARREFVLEVLRSEKLPTKLPDKAIFGLLNDARRFHQQIAGVDAKPLTHHGEGIPFGAEISDMPKKKPLCRARHKRNMSNTGHADGPALKKKKNTRRHLKNLDISTQPEADNQTHVSASPIQISTGVTQGEPSLLEQSDFNDQDVGPESPITSEIALASLDRGVGCPMAIDVQVEDKKFVTPDTEHLNDNSPCGKIATFQSTSDASHVTPPMFKPEAQNWRQHLGRISKSIRTQPDHEQAGWSLNTPIAGTGDDCIILSPPNSTRSRQPDIPDGPTILDEAIFHVPDTSTTSVPKTSRSPQSRLPRRSRFFQEQTHEPLSCLPFCSIDFPYFGLVQEQLAHDPFKLLIATIFLNRTRADVALRVLFDEVFAKYPSVDAMAAADEQELALMIHRLGFHNQRARKCIALAQTWQTNPPVKNKRYRRIHYPGRGDGKDISQNEVVDDEDHRSAWEVAHLPGVGAYSIDSWRMFCRDELRELARDWKGTGALASGFVPEWKSVLPLDKELRAYATWMWLKEGWVWDRLTGDLTPASEKMLIAAKKGGVVFEEGGNLVLRPEPPRAPNGLHGEYSPMSI